MNQKNDGNMSLILPQEHLAQKRQVVFRNLFPPS